MIAHHIKAWDEDLITRMQDSSSNTHLLHVSYVRMVFDWHEEKNCALEELNTSCSRDTHVEEDA